MASYVIIKRRHQQDKLNNFPIVKLEIAYIVIEIISTTAKLQNSALTSFSPTFLCTIITTIKNEDP